KIGLVSTTIKKRITPRIERIEGYKETLINHQLKVCEEWIVATKRSNIINELEKLWESGNFPNAFFAVNDFSLIELLKFLKSKDLQIRSEEHTSELQSRFDLVCRLLLEKEILKKQFI